MSCEICGRGSCCKSFHSLEEQTNFDDVADKVKENTIQIVINVLNRIDGDYQTIDGKEVYLIDLNEAIEKVEDIF